jgi:hypothetical protein
MQRTKKELITQQICSELIRLAGENKIILTVEGEDEIVNFLEQSVKREFYALDNAYFAGQTEGVDYCTHFRTWFTENYVPAKLKF